MSLWRCDVCDQGIRPGTGFVEIVDRPATGLPGGYPSEPTPDVAFTGGWGEPVVLTMPRIAFRVAHHRCDPDLDGQGYWIGVERARTLEEWVSWVLHVGQKTWMGRRDILMMLSYWFSNRGASWPDVRELSP
jgi:hypothetical protein